MKITNKLIQDIAALAKLEFDEQSGEQMKADLEKIIGFVDKLNALMAAILGLLAPLCPIITAISIIMIVAKVITLIPSFGGGMGAVVVATMPGNIAQAIYTFAVDILNKINKVVFIIFNCPALHYNQTS